MIKLIELGLRRGAKIILNKADLTIFPKEKVGLVGQNGSGKTTLLNALLGQLSLESGAIDIPKSWVVAAMTQEIHDVECSVIDFVLGGDKEYQSIQKRIEHAQTIGNDSELGSLYDELQAIDGFTAPSRAASILAGLGFKESDNERKVKEFSGGWQMRMNLARVLGSRADLLLLDEPTNHLDIDAVLWLQAWIRGLASTVIVVSHDRDFLDETCTHTVHLFGEKLSKYTGGYSSYESAFAQKNAQIEQINKKTELQAKHLQSFIDRFKAKATKAKQAQSRVKRLEKLQLVEQAKVEDAPLILFPEPLKAPDPLVVISRGVCGYQPNTPILSNVTIEIRPGDRIGLLGANGNGKTTLVKTLVGLLPPIDGERVEGKGLIAGYFAQNEIESLDLESSPLEHLKRLDKLSNEQVLRGFLAKFHFTGDKIFQEVKGFSGGEKSRLALALIAYRRPNLLLLDEPTNHLDIGSRQSLASGLLDYPGALVVVSHDRHLLESITDKFYKVSNGEVHEFEGDLDDYALSIKNDDANKQSTQNQRTVTSDKENNKPDNSYELSKRLKSEQRKLEKAIERDQAKLNEIDELLQNLDYTDVKQSEDSGLLSTQRSELLKSIETAEDQLLELMLELEGLGQ